MSTFILLCVVSLSGSGAFLSVLKVPHIARFKSIYDKKVFLIHFTPSFWTLYSFFPPSVISTLVLKVCIALK
jgi:hypothetical protein